MEKPKGRDFLDVEGATFGTFTIGKYVGFRSHQQFWKATCECGFQTELSSQRLRKDNYKRCACSKTIAEVTKPGDVIGRLTAVRRIRSDGKYGPVWAFRCSCGTEVERFSHRIRQGTTKSCGCFGIETRLTKNFRHGHAKNGNRSREYSSYRCMIARCYNPKAKNYKSYGGRGIRVCDAWLKDFRDFLAHVGLRPQGHTLDRIDNDKGYEPGNVRWATRAQQDANTRRMLAA